MLTAIRHLPSNIVYFPTPFRPHNTRKSSLSFTSASSSKPSRRYSCLIRFAASSDDNNIKATKKKAIVNVPKKNKSYKETEAAPSNTTVIFRLTFYLVVIAVIGTGIVKIFTGPGSTSPWVKGSSPILDDNCASTFEVFEFRSI
ncbi:hypothetical protein Tco_1469004 [Tanacetum coccineum]